MRPRKSSHTLCTMSLVTWILFSASGCIRQAQESKLEVDSAGAVKLTTGDKETYAKLLEQHRGKVVLVDFWATWCAPCVVQFPHTVELSDKHRNQGLAVISVSMNEPDDFESVLAFLTKRKARFDNLLPEYGAGAKFVEAFDLRGDVPFYRLYDRRGELRYSFSSDPDGLENCDDISKIDERVEQLVLEQYE